MRFLPAVILASVALALGACGGDDDEGDSASTGTTGAETAPAETTPTETAPAEDEGGSGGEKYPQRARRNFLRACEAQQGATLDVCECSLEALEERYSYEEFLELERQGPKSREIQAALGEIAQECVERN